MSKYSLRSKSKPRANGNTSTTVSKVDATQADKYKKRDAHEVFFRPCAANVRKAPVCKQKKKKPKPWSNKQRQAFALAHWKQHHGDDTASAAAVDTECKISTASSTQTSSSSNCTPIRTRQPAKTTKTPIWISTSTAMRAVFSSSDCDFENGSTTVYL